MHTPVTRPTSATNTSPLTRTRTHAAPRGAATVAALALAAAAVVGCDDTTRADKDVRSKLATAAHPADESARAQSISTLESAVQVGGASPSAKAQAAATLARAEMEEAARLVRKVDENQRQMAQLTFEIGQLGSLVQEANHDVEAYKLLEPVEARRLAQEQVAAAEGGADKPAWFEHEGATIPTLAAARQEIGRLEAEIAKREEQVKQLAAQRDEARKRAEALFVQADQQSGTQSVATFKQGADARKQAEDLATQIEVVEASLVPLRQDLAVAQNHQKAAQTAVEQYRQVVARLDAGWNQVQQASQQRASLAASLVGAGDGGGGATAQGGPEGESGSAAGAAGGAGATLTARTIAAKADLMAQKAAAAREAFDNAEQYLNNAITHYETAVGQANNLSTAVKSKSSGLDRNSPLRQAYDALLETVSPAVYKLGQADANQMLAMLQGSRVVGLRERADMLKSLTPTLEQAGLQVPAALRDLAPEADVAAAATAAGEKFEAAGQLYLDVMEGALGSEPRKNAGRVGRIFALYGQVQLARAMGDEAKANALLAEATAAREVAAQANAVLPAMPVELLPATRPTTAPATAPAAPTAGAF